jgi:hypothetical protein
VKSVVMGMSMSSGTETETLEELVKKIKAKDLREEAKKRGIKTACVKKIDLAKQLPREVVEELSSKQ